MERDRRSEHGVSDEPAFIANFEDFIMRRAADCRHSAVNDLRFEVHEFRGLFFFPGVRFSVEVGIQK